MAHTIDPLFAQDPQRMGNVLSAACPSRAILHHVTGRWGTLVLVALGDKTLRFSELRRKVDGISERMLAQTLQILESHALVTRRAHDVVPPHVDYQLTPLGAEIMERLLSLAEWIETNLPRLIQNMAQKSPDQDDSV